MQGSNRLPKKKKRKKNSIQLEATAVDPTFTTVPNTDCWHLHSHGYEKLFLPLFFTRLMTSKAAFPGVEGL